MKYFCFQFLLAHIILSCDAATSAAARTYIACKELKESEDEDVINYITFVKYHRVYFTAHNFFEINRKTYLTIANLVVNYIIVLLQFNGISLN